MKQSFISKLFGSPFPGAIACLMKTNLLPSLSEFKILSSDKALVFVFKIPINKMVKIFLITIIFFN